MILEVSFYNHNMLKVQATGLAVPGRTHICGPVIQVELFIASKPYILMLKFLSSNKCKFFGIRVKAGNPAFMQTPKNLH
jgi:hypothetical protein